MPKDEKYLQYERDLIKACQENNRKAQYEFYQLYSSKFLGIVYRFAGNEDTANDLLQEAFIRIFKNIHMYRFEGSFEGWMRRIVIRTSIDYIKKYYQFQFDDVDSDHLESIGELPAQIEQMNCEAILEEIKSLPDGFRTILNLYAIDGYSYTEIAAMLDIKEVTVRSQYMRAKQRLAQALKEKHQIYYDSKTV
jgi:RNA polymerase sigma factor (sigma-70 family)